MHQYIEAVRTELEIAAGAESYLAGALFMRLQNSLAYEDDGEERLHHRDGYELVQHKAINCLKTPHDFDLNQEVLSWQAALLRHATKEFYHWWIQYKNQKFQGPDFFADGEGCMAIESACEKIGGNPTENFTLILEIEHLLVKLTTGPGKMLSELKRFWEFKRINQSAQNNPFTVKRIQVEQAGTQKSSWCPPPDVDERSLGTQGDVRLSDCLFGLPPFGQPGGGLERLVAFLVPRKAGRQHPQPLVPKRAAPPGPPQDDPGHPDVVAPCPEKRAGI